MRSPEALPETWSTPAALWLPHLFPEVLEGRIVATRQEVYHFAPAPGDTRFAPPELPVWADFNAGDLVLRLA
jgi:hypothetical protein